MGAALANRSYDHLLHTAWRKLLTRDGYWIKAGTGRNPEFGPTFLKDYDLLQVLFKSFIYLCCSYLEKILVDPVAGLLELEVEVTDHGLRQPGLINHQ